MHCSVENAADPIWRVLASFDGISCWTPLKPQHSNHNPNPLVNQLWYIDFLTPPTPLIIPQRLSAFLESLMPLKNWCSIHARWSKSSLKHSIRFFGLFSNFKTKFYCLSFFLTSRLHFWNSPAVTINSNSCCSFSFKPEVIKIGQSSHNMYSNKILNFQESMTILNTCTKKSGNLLNAPRKCYLKNMLGNYISKIYINDWHLVAYNVLYALKPNQTAFLCLIYLFHLQ